MTKSKATRSATHFFWVAGLLIVMLCSYQADSGFMSWVESLHPERTSSRSNSGPGVQRGQLTRARGMALRTAVLFWGCLVVIHDVCSYQLDSGFVSWVEAPHAALLKMLLRPQVPERPMEVTDRGPGCGKADGCFSWVAGCFLWRSVCIRSILLV